MNVVVRQPGSFFSLMFTRIFIIAAIVAVSLPGCSKGQVPDVIQQRRYVGGIDVKPRGERLLGLGVTEGSIGYEAAFNEARAAGVQFVELAQQWDEVELSPGKFESLILGIANRLNPASGTAIVLSINPIDTANLRVPKHLRGQAFDSPDFISAFNQFVDFVFAGLPDAKIVAVSLGNEVDGWLADDNQKWSQYARFMAAVSEHLRTTHPDIPIGVKTTWPAITGAHKREINAVNQWADAVMVTYYPLNDDFSVRPANAVGKELGQLVQIAGEKPLFLLETGYPSGAENGSSEQKQAEFVEAVFAAWDEHSESIQIVNFVWLCDMSKSEVTSLTEYYAVKSPAFASYLATLGLKTHEGIDKQAFRRLKECAKSRGWD